MTGTVTTRETVVEFSWSCASVLLQYQCSPGGVETTDTIIGVTHKNTLAVRRAEDISAYAHSVHFADQFKIMMNRTARTNNQCFSYCTLHFDFSDSSDELGFTDAAAWRSLAKSFNVDLAFDSTVDPQRSACVSAASTPSGSKAISTSRSEPPRAESRTVRSTRQARSCKWIDEGKWCIADTTRFTQFCDSELKVLMTTS